MSQRPHIRRTPRAFSMVELLVAMSVLSVMMVILLSIVNGTTRMWRVSENRVDSYREVRAALSVINKDLKSALVSSRPELFKLDLKEVLPPSAIQPPTANSVFFVASLPSDSQDSSDQDKDGKPDNLSELCIVGYFLAYDSPTFGKVEPSMNLYRYFKSSGLSLASLKNGNPLASEISTSVGSDNIEVLARNVTGLKINAFMVDANGKPTSTDGTAGVPDFIDVQVTALNNDSAKKMKKDNWYHPDEGKMKNVFAQEARTFSTRVNVAPYKIESAKNSTPAP